LESCKRSPTITIHPLILFNIPEIRSDHVRSQLSK
jgi:hypothetical protein